MRTLVTGGAGFIGGHLVRELVARGDEVVVLDSLEEQVHDGVTPQLPDSVELIVGDVGDRACADRALRGCRPRRAPGRGRRRRSVDVRDRSLHRAQHDADRDLPRAARRPATAADAPGRGLLDVDLRRGRIRLPRARAHSRPPRGPRSSCWRVSGSSPAPHCGAVLKPVGTRESKAADPDLDLRDHQARPRGDVPVTGAAYGIPTMALRFFNVYGPARRSPTPTPGVAAIFASRLLNGRPPVIFEDGGQTRDFIHV